MYLFWLCLDFTTVHGASLVAVNGGSSLVAAHRLLIAGTAPVVEHGL